MLLLCIGARNTLEIQFPFEIEGINWMHSKTTFEPSRVVKWLNGEMCYNDLCSVPTRKKPKVLRHTCTTTHIKWWKKLLFLFKHWQDSKSRREKEWLMNILPLPFDVLLRIVERLTKVYYYARLESKTNSKTRSIHLEKSPYLPHDKGVPWRSRKTYHFWRKGNSLITAKKWILWIMTRD